jgi:chromosome segregation ATPase
MSENKLTVEVQEPETKAPEEAQQAAEQAEEESREAEQAAEQAQAESNQAAQAAETAVAAAQVATEKAEQAQETTKQISSLELSVETLLRNFDLITRRVEQVASIVEKTEQDMAALMAEMRATMELHQDQVAEIANAAEAVTTAAAALVKLHKEQSAKE